MRIAVMQPYFFPYAGYFRLMAAADRFVIFDDVQFPRRGWVHRNRFLGDDGEIRTLTLPLQKAPFDALISELSFPGDGAARLKDALRRFPALRDADPGEGLLAAALDLTGSPVDYLERTLAACCEALDLPFHPLRSSSLAIDPALRAQDRILAICERLGASAYVNAPGGVDLYDGEAFAARGVALAFLTPWQGSYGSVLERLLSEDPRSVGEGIRRETVLVPAGSAAPGGEAAAA